MGDMLVVPWKTDGVSPVVWVARETINACLHLPSPRLPWSTHHSTPDGHNTLRPQLYRRFTQKRKRIIAKK